MTVSIRVIMWNCHSGLFNVWTQWNLIAPCVPWCGPMCHQGSASPHSDPGTQGFSDMWLYQVTWRPPDPLPSADNDHKTMVCKTDRKVVSGRPRRSHSWLALPLVRPEPWGKRGSEMQNSTDIAYLRTWGTCTPSGPCICAGNPIHLLQEEYSERRIK